ncbi:MAG: hypothetical protein ACTSQF_15805 [Candidatus Heimdallarchaeaceae archaeon]
MMNRRISFSGTADSGVFRRKAVGSIVIPEFNQLIPLVVSIIIPIAMVVIRIKRKELELTSSF